MKIENKYTERVCFSSIAQGETFRHDSKLYIRMYQVTDNGYNSLNLETGNVRRYHPNDKVCPIKAKVVVE